MAKIERFVFNHIEVNTYLVYDETLSCVVIDPGMENHQENESLEGFIDDHGLKVEAILLTHTHFDHIAGLKWMYDKYQPKVYLHADSQKIMRQAEIYASVLGFDTGVLGDIPVTIIDEGDTIEFGHSRMEVLFVPGHAAGSLCFCMHSDKAVFTGDALFCGSIGRTDLPTGDMGQLMENLRAKVISLPEDYKVYPGHGPNSTIANEKVFNPFFNPGMRHF